MAEILIKAKDYTHPDPIKDRIGSYKIGMIVMVTADGYGWGPRESKQVWLAQGGAEVDWPGKFVIVRIPGVAVSTVLEIMAEQFEDDNNIPQVDEEGDPTVYRRRRWRILVSSIPASIKNTLLADGEVTVTKAKIRNYIRRIRDNFQFEGL